MFCRSHYYSRHDYPQFSWFKFLRLCKQPDIDIEQWIYGQMTEGVEAVNPDCGPGLAAQKMYSVGKIQQTTGQCKPEKRLTGCPCSLVFYEKYHRPGQCDCKRQCGKKTVNHVSHGANLRKKTLSNRTFIKDLLL